MPKLIKFHGGQASASAFNNIRFFLVALAASLVLSACGGSSSNSGSPDDASPDSASTSGSAQKGPFQPGGIAKASQLKADGSLGGKSVTGDIASDGGFNLTNINWSGPTELKMTGAFFNEFVGNFSMGANSNATLYSIVSFPDDANTNVNIFTHFITARTKNLMAQSTAFNTARDQARNELASIMGISSPPNSLNLLQDNGNSAHQNDSANLLLFSAAILAVEVEQIGIDAIASDFADDGQINDAGLTAFNEIQQTIADHPDLLTTARNNLQAQYSVVSPDNTSGIDPVWVPGAPAMPIATFTTNGPLEVGANQSFDANGSTGDTLSYAWNFGDGETALGSEPTHAYTNTGTFAATLTVTDEYGRISTYSLDLTITEITTTPEPPTPSFSVSGNQFTDHELTFDASGSMGSDLSYVWTFDDGMMGYGEQKAHTYTAPGDYNVKLKVVDSAGQTAESTQALTITPIPELIGQMVTASDGEEKHVFGYSVAIDDDTAVIGARYAEGGTTSQQGAAYVYTRNSGGIWSEQAKLEATEGGFEFLFGNSVAISGDTIVVGEPNRKGDRSDPYSNHGAAYVFTRSNDEWNLQKKLLPSNTSMEEVGFGFSVATDGDVIMVGRLAASGHRINGYVEGPYSGAVYVYQRSGNTWSQQTKLLPNGLAENDVVLEQNRFGESAVALSGNTVVIGDPTPPHINGPGSAYVFTKSGGSWSQQAKLTASEPTPDASFGKKIAIDGNTVVVGAPQDSAVGGAVHVFTGSGANWNEQAKLTLSDGEISDYFGASVAIAGDTIMATTAYNSANNEPAYVFTRLGNQWSEQALRVNTGSSLDTNPNGGAIAIDGNTTLIGVRHGNKQGAAYFYSTSDLVQ